MHIHVFSCRVFSRELSYYASQSDNMIDITWLPQGLHERPGVLHTTIEESIADMYDQLEHKLLKRTPDYIALCYGVCSKGMDGLTATDIPLVIPRTDDCIGIFLGSQERYMECFEKYPGTYWLNSGWIENSPEIDPDYHDRMLEYYTERYGEETAEYLLETNKTLLKNYKSIGYIESDVYKNDEHHQRAAEYAAENGWTLEDFDGDDRIIRKLVAGDWDEKDFLVVEPGYKAQFTTGPERLVAVKA